MRGAFEPRVWKAPRRQRVLSRRRRNACVLCGALALGCAAISLVLSLGLGVKPISAEVASASVMPELPGALASIQSPEDLQSSPTDSPDVQPASDGLVVLTGRIRRGGTLGSTLAKQGLPAPVVQEIASALRPVFDVRAVQPNDLYALIRDPNGEVLSFEIQRGRKTVYRVERSEDGALEPSATRLAKERRLLHVGGTVEKSLFESMLTLGERPELVQAFADIFAFELDFSTQTRPGDEFRLVFEKFYDQNGFVEYGNILAAQYRNDERDHTAIRFEDEHGERAGYFTPDGKSVRRSFLRAPVNYTRISSGYSLARLHPIFKVRRKHEGIDYAAPAGTPVWSIGDGVVAFQGWQGGFGRLVKIRHANGFISYYGHLSRFSHVLRVGSRVSQKQVIGYVGSSGWATGPHLDFRLQRNGRFVNPLQVKFPHGDPIRLEDRERFESVRDELLAELLQTEPGLVLEAGM
jgi:murein DD-endopeptidase MepM/ murein hydrolase activator NlpD